MNSPFASRQATLIRIGQTMILEEDMITRHDFPERHRGQACIVVGRNASNNCIFVRFSGDDMVYEFYAARLSDPIAMTIPKTGNANDV